QTVDDGDLAMVAQIQPRAARPQQAKWEQRDYFRTGRAELRRELVQRLARAHAVQQETAAHASAGGLLRRLRRGLPRAVVGEDGVQQVHAALCGLNVLQQALQRSLIVVQQLNAIAARQIEAAEVAGETSRLGDLDRQVRGDLRCPWQSLGHV